MSGSWEGIFQEVEGGTQLTCTETVMARHWWMRPFVPGYLKRQQKRYLKDLRKKLLKQAMLTGVACSHGSFIVQYERKE